MSNFQLTEEFNDPQGRFINYDTIDFTAQQSLDGRTHINLRSFANDPDSIPKTMDYLDSLDLEGLTMEDLESNRDYIASENWSTGTAGPSTALGHRNALVLTCTTGANTSTSTLDPISLSGFVGEVSIALPSFPAGSLNLANSNLALSDGTTTVTLPLSSSLTTPTTGNSEAHWPISALNGLGSVTTVTFHFQATANCTVVIAALRLLGPTWTPTVVDPDTRHQRLEPILTRTGTVPTTAFPRIWRSSDAPGSHSDPRPFDSRISTLFNTGSQTDTNSFTLYMRERREDFLVQLDLDGADLDADGVLDIGESQQSLDQLGKQPDYGISQYDPTDQSVFDVLEQNDIDATPQALLERFADTLHQSWIEVKISWSGTALAVTIKNTETLDSAAYSFTQAALDANTEYVAEVDLRDNTMRVQIFTITGLGAIEHDNLVFDSSAITDDFMFPRFKGRLGWTFDLKDGDTYVKSLRTQYLMFGEYRSHPFESRTPVAGARLYANNSPDRELYVGGNPYKDAVVTIDESLSNSDDGSIRITTNKPGGFRSLPMVFDDFANSNISFDIFFPKARLDEGIRPVLALVNDRGYYIELPIQHLIPDQWFHISLVPLQAQLDQTGSYSLVFLEPSAVPTTFWIDNISVSQRTVVWSGRAKAEDPWGVEEARWTEFRDLVNTNSGVLFPERGRFAQVRGQALNQDAFIEKVYFKPKYAELGRFVWCAEDRGYHTVASCGNLEPIPAPEVPTPEVGPGPGPSGPNWSFEHPLTIDGSTGTPGWGSYPNDPWGNTDFELVERTQDFSTDGSWSLHVRTPTTGGTGECDFSAINPDTWTGVGGSAPNGWWPVVAGQTWTFELDVRVLHSNSTNNVFINIDYFDSSFTYRHEDYTGAHMTSGDTTLTVVSTVPVGAVWASPYFQCYYDSGDIATEAYIDRVSWTLAP